MGGRETSRSQERLSTFHLMGLCLKGRVLLLLHAHEASRQVTNVLTSVSSQDGLLASGQANSVGTNSFILSRLISRIKIKRTQRAFCHRLHGSSSTELIRSDFNMRKRSAAEGGTSRHSVPNKRIILSTVRADITAAPSSPHAG